MSKELVSKAEKTVGKTVTSKNVWNVRGRARLAFGAAVFACGTAATAAPIGVIDTFEDADLSEYTLTKVLDQGDGTSNISFFTTGGRLSVRSTGTTGAEQVLFLRDDYSLGIGEQLLADVPGAVSQPGPTFDRDFGIAVSFTETPTGLGNPAAGDTRTNFLEISRRDRNAVNFFSRNGTANVTGNVFLTNETEAISLFIARVSADTFEVGYLLNGTRRVISTTGLTFADPIPSAAVGVYSDLRTNVTAPVLLDNLRIEVVPEPASLALLASCGLFALRRRREV